MIDYYQLIHEHIARFNNPDTPVDEILSFMQLIRQTDYPCYYPFR